MKAEDKTKEQLKRDLVKLRQRVAKFEQAESERLRVEETLKQAEQEKKAILDSLLEHVVYHDMDMKVLWANRAACESVGLPREELIGRQCYTIWAKRSDRCQDCPVEEARETGQPQALRKTTPDGRSWFIQASPVRDSNGDISGMVELALEISERRLAEEALRASEERFRTVADYTYDWEYWIDPDGNLLYVSPSSERLTGYCPDEFEEHPSLLETIAHPNDRSVVRRHLTEELESQEVVSTDFRIITKSGEERWIGHICQPVYSTDEPWLGRRASNRDITQRKRAEEALKKAHDELELRVEKRTGELLMANEKLKEEIEERKRAEEALREKEKTLQAILAASPVGIGLVRNRVLDWANQSMYRIWGYQEGSLLGRSAEVLYPDADEYERVGRDFYTGIEENEIGQVETRWVTKDGNFILCYLQGTPLHPSDLSKGVIVAAMDVTDLKQAEEALRESEERFRQAFENASIGMCLVDTEGRLMRVNRQMCEIFGYSQEALEGMTVNDITHPDYLDVSPRFIQRASSGEISHAEFEKQYCHKKGHIVWGQVTSSLVRDDSGAPLYFISHVKDITERKIAEERLHTYQEQLLSLASELLLTEERQRRRLATDLHDSIGQALAIAKLKLDTLRSTSPSPASNKDLDEVCELIGQAIEQARYLTFELSPTVLYQFGLEAAIESLAERVQQQHDLSINFTAGGQPKPLPEEVRVLLYRAVQELLVNIVKHARASRVTISIGRENDYTQILVADDGMGFDLTEIESHHTAGKFGLFSIRERLHHLGGRFEVVSKPDQGTKVTLAAPYAQSGKVR